VPLQQRHLISLVAVAPSSLLTITSTR
jgi:hypothetical protein